MPQTLIDTYFPREHYQSSRGGWGPAYVSNNRGIRDSLLLRGDGKWCYFENLLKSQISIEKQHKKRHEPC